MAPATAAAMSAAIGDDAELLGLEPRFIAALAAYDRAWETRDGDDPEVQEATDAVCDVADRIVCAPAR